MTVRSKTYFQEKFVPGYPLKAEDLDDLVDSAVFVETGKGLSSNDYTTGEKNKLASLSANFKGYFATGTALALAFPESNPGDYAIVASTDTIWVWDTDTTSWVNSGTESGVTQQYVDEQLALKQDKLTTDQLADINAIDQPVSTAEKNTWNGKQNALDAPTLAKIAAIDQPISTSEKNAYAAKQNALTEAQLLALNSLNLDMSGLVKTPLSVFGLNCRVWLAPHRINNVGDEQQVPRNFAGADLTQIGATQNPIWRASPNLDGYELWQWDGVNDAVTIPSEVLNARTGCCFGILFKADEDNATTKMILHIGTGTTATNPRVDFGIDRAGGTFYQTQVRRLDADAAHSVAYGKNDTEWTKVIVNIDFATGTCQMWINDIKLVENTYPTTGAFSATNSLSQLVGANTSAGANGFKDYIADLFIVNRPATAQEIADLNLAYNQQYPTIEQNSLAV